MLRYKFESNSQQAHRRAPALLNVYAMLRYKFESNSQLSLPLALQADECVCYA